MRWGIDPTVCSYTVYTRTTPVSDRDLDLMKRMGIKALYRKTKPTKKHPPNPHIA